MYFTLNYIAKHKFCQLRSLHIQSEAILNSHRHYIIITYNESDGWGRKCIAHQIEVFSVVTYLRHTYFFISYFFF